MDILLDGKKIINKKTLYLTLKDQINCDEFYGNNLDALWEVLSSVEEEIKIIINNQQDLINNLGEYADLLLELFHDLKDVNELVFIEVK
ncbi:MAG: barstar family protein [Bacilli bacterium]|nr:barstar family protein [Bacilli bacterium]MDD3121650.1 barstar family protein [Bacilli bacterium]